MNTGPVHEIGPGEGYDIDSDEFESGDEAGLDEAEYDQLVDEGGLIIGLDEGPM